LTGHRLNDNLEAPKQGGTTVMKLKKVRIIGLVLGLTASLAVTPPLTATAVRRPAARPMMRLRLKVNRPAKQRKVTVVRRHRTTRHR